MQSRRDRPSPFRLRVFALAAAACVALAPRAGAQPAALADSASDSAASRDRATIAWLTDTVFALAERDRAYAGWTVAVLRGPDTLLLRGFGFSDLENEVQATDSTVYRVGSISKQFLAALVVRLAERGALSLDDPVSRWLSYPWARPSLTIRRLLEHTSGVPNYVMRSAAWRARWPDALPPESLVALAGESLEFDPGTAWRYSNTNYVLLGMVVERVTSRRLSDLLREELVEPLGLRETRVCEGRALVPGLAKGYSTEGGEPRPAPYIDDTHMWATAGICSTVRDLLRWQDALDAGRAVSPESWRAMTTPARLANDSTARYGLGTHVGALRGEPEIGHTGGVHGYMASMMSYPRSRLRIVVLMNAAPVAVQNLVHEIAARLLPPTSGDPPPAR